MSGLTIDNNETSEANKSRKRMQNEKYRRHWDIARISRGEIYKKFGRQMARMPRGIIYKKIV